MIQVPSEKKREEVIRVTAEVALINIARSCAPGYLELLAHDKTGAEAH